MAESIQYVGAGDLSKKDKDTLNKLSAEYYEKISRELKNTAAVRVHIKAYKKSGKQKKFSVHIQVTSPGQHIESTKTHDWDFARTIHKAFQDVENRIHHTLHDTNQNPQHIRNRMRRHMESIKGFFLGRK